MPETVSAVEDAYVAFQFVDHPVVIVPKVEVAFAKVLSPLHVLLFAKSVDDAAFMVNVPPAVIAVVFMVAKVPVKNPVPTDVVATTRPF